MNDKPPNNQAKSPMGSLLTAGGMLTASRLILLPVIIGGIALDQGYVAAAGMAAALLTDLLDGRISRRMGTASEFGGNLDSTVDFIFIHLLFVALYAAGRLATYQFALIYLVMLATIVLQMLGGNVSAQQGVVRVKFGKPTGALEYLFLLLLMVREVLPHVQVMGTLNIVLFSAFAVFALIYIVEVVMKLRMMVQPT